jgi:hypothetical protein
MPARVLKCEGCGRYRSLLIHEGELAETETKDSIERYCATCHLSTRWDVAFPGVVDTNVNAA